MLQRYGSCLLVPVLAILMSLLPAMADDDHDHDRERSHHRQEQLRDAVARGDIRPLSDVLRIVKPKLPGEIVGVEVERKASGWIYELRALDANGRVYDVHVDGATASILGIEEK